MKILAGSFLQVNDAQGNVTTIIVDKDDGIREDTNIAALRRLRPAFDKHGTTTAGKLLRHFRFLGQT